RHTIFSRDWSSDVCSSDLNTLRYSDAPARVDIRLTVEGNQARIDWQDSSPGVADEDLARLTERLYRVDASRASHSGGSGLGLARSEERRVEKERRAV